MCLSEATRSLPVNVILIELYLIVTKLMVVLLMIVSLC